MKQMASPIIPSYTPTRFPVSVNKRFALLVPAALIAVTVATFGLVSTADAQSPSPGLVIEALTITQVGESATAMTYQAEVTIANSGASDFSGIQRVDYQIDGGDKQLAYIVTALQVGQTLTFTFNFELAPGEHTVRLEVGESARMPTITVTGADIGVEITDYRFKPGRIVEFDLEIANSGDLTAEDLALTSAWQNAATDVDGQQSYSDELPDLAPGESTSVNVPIRLTPGSYDFVFSGSTRTIEGESGNNSAKISLDVEFIDLRTNVVSTESLGWDGDGNSLMSITVQVVNEGVDGINTFYIGVECDGQWEDSCSTSSQSDEVPAGESVQTEIRLWLPIGNIPTRIFAVEDEDTFRWGNLNAIDHTIEVPDAPDLVWTLSKIATPEVASYWSDGSANVDLNLTFVNNGTEKAQVIVVTCSQNDVIVNDCGAEFSVQREPDIYPTVIKQTLRLPHGETNLAISYGADETESTSMNVPKRITGVERDVWECFSDTSYMELQNTDDEHDEGIGCGGWRKQYIRKWPYGEPIKTWSTGNPQYIHIFEDVLADLGPFLNLEFESVSSRSEAQFLAYVGVPVEDAEDINFTCVEFAGCAGYDELTSDGTVVETSLVVWDKSYDWDPHYLSQSIRATILHELLHALTGISHRHHDRTSVMSYDALDYTTIDGIDEGMFQLFAHPLVKPGMTFNEVLDLIVFTDELNDPPEPELLTAEQFLRRASAAMIDAGSVRFEIRGDWPGCGGNHRFGPATYEIGNLKLGREHWVHFENNREHYYIIIDPDEPYDFDDGELVEYWINKGHKWVQTDHDEFYGRASNFRDYWSNPMDMLSHINIWGNPSQFDVALRASNVVVLEIALDGPNPDPWSRGVDVDIRIEMNPENYEISKYRMTWNFDPLSRYSCDTYEVEAKNSVYGFDFTFPDAIREDSQVLAPETIPDEPDTEVEVVTVN